VCQPHPVELLGNWRLVAWRRIAADGTVTFPLGPDASGVLVYGQGNRMCVVMTAARRPAIDGDDPLGGEVEERAGGYSTCLAYAGTYERDDDTVVHRIEESLFPNWSGTTQPRAITFRDGELVLRTIPAPGGSGQVVNEIIWSRCD
jgi:hypothetical protein